MDFFIGVILPFFIIFWLIPGLIYIPVFIFHHMICTKCFSKFRSSSSFCYSCGIPRALWKR